MTKQKNSILIADDSASGIAALTQILQDDYRLFTASDGPSCIDLARKNAPDLILLDIIMPGMDGFEVIARLKRDAQTQHIPVIIITGLANDHDEEKGFLLGAADYINKPFSPSVVKLRVRNQIQIITQLRHIHTLSFTDELTGIGNRRYFYGHLEQEWQRALRNRVCLAFMMIDVDHFKLYNDTHGHLQGDVALVSVAQTVKASLTRAIDRVARWGGEEFSVLLPETDLAGAFNVAERIRSKVEAIMPPLADGTPTVITVSIGIHSTVPRQNDDYPLMRFVAGADRALYHAKSTGRNRIHAAGDLPA